MDRICSVNGSILFGTMREMTAIGNQQSCCEGPYLSFSMRNERTARREFEGYFLVSFMILCIPNVIGVFSLVYFN